MTDAMIPRRFAAGALIYSRSEPAAGIYVVRSGVALFYLSGESGRRLLIKIIPPNGILGGSVSYDGRAALVSAEARSPLETDLIPTARLVRLRQEHPEIGAAIAQTIARNLRLAFDLLEEQALLDLRQRALRRLPSTNIAADCSKPLLSPDEMPRIAMRLAMPVWVIRRFGTLVEICSRLADP